MHDPCQGLEAEDVKSIDWVLCQGRPKEPANTTALSTPIQT